MQLESVVEERLKAGRAALQRGQHWLALPALKDLLQAEPEHVEAFELLGIAHTLAGEPDSARAAFRKATRLAPGRASAHFNYAIFLFNDNDLDEAAVELHATLYLEPTHVGAIQLQQQLNERLRFRGVTADEGFAVVGTRGRNLDSMPGLETLQCPTCGGMNRVMAKVCKKCNSFIPEMPDIVPVE
jgi:tetratricopeptide (TPR) repeat protein